MRGERWSWEPPEAVGVPASDAVPSWHRRPGAPGDSGSSGADGWLPSRPEPEERAPSVPSLPSPPSEVPEADEAVGPPAPGGTARSDDEAPDATVDGEADVEADGEVARLRRRAAQTAASAYTAAHGHPTAHSGFGDLAEEGGRRWALRPRTAVTALVVVLLVAVGGPALLRERGLDPLPDAAAWAEDGSTVLHVVVSDDAGARTGTGTASDARSGEVVGAFALADAIRPESREAVDALHRRGIRVVMITGDAEPVARAVGRELGIDQVFAGVRPEDKDAKVAELQHSGRVVAMVGDGVNDAPALAQADVGIAIGAGTDVAIASAGVILASSDPRAVLSIIELSHASYRKMQQNLWWAAGYNIVAVPLAAGVLAPVGFVMPMAVGAILMSASTVIVALNAQLLRRTDLDPARLASR